MQFPLNLAACVYVLLCKYSHKSVHLMIITSYESRVIKPILLED